MKLKSLILLMASVVVAVSSNAQDRIGTTTGGPLIVAGVPIYPIFDDGVLGWQYHRGARNGSPDWANGGVLTKIANSWNEGLNVFKGAPDGSTGVIYRVDSHGDLYWYKHRGWFNGSRDMEGPSRVGNGWSTSRLGFGAGNGVIYRVDEKGDLYWYRHLAPQTGEFKWANGGIGAKVGVGWGEVRIGFSGGNGVVYLIDRQGDLYWYKHLGFFDGSFSWANGAKGIKVGSGWNDAAQAFSGGNGVIYVLKRDGDLYWYNHTGFANGAVTWTSNTGQKIGTGWGNTVRIF